jgi:hypothetical protein
MRLFFTSEAIFSSRRADGLRLFTVSFGATPRWTRTQQRHRLRGQHVVSRPLILGRKLITPIDLSRDQLFLMCTTHKLVNQKREVYSEVPGEMSSAAGGLADLKFAVGGDNSDAHLNVSKSISYHHPSPRGVSHQACGR